MAWFNRKKKESDMIVWGIWVERGIRATFKALALNMRVPISVIVTHILLDWIQRNKDDIGNEVWLTAYGDGLANLYLRPDE